MFVSQSKKGRGHHVYAWKCIDVVLMSPRLVTFEWRELVWIVCMFILGHIGFPAVVTRFLSTIFIALMLFKAAAAVMQNAYRGGGAVV